MELLEYQLQLNVSELLGTIPKDPEIFKRYIESQKPAEVKDSESESVTKAEQGGWTGFHKDDKGLFHYDYFVKGFLKNAANVMKDQLGISGLKQKVVNFVFVEPRKIYFMRNGKVIQDVDGNIEQAITGWTPSGKITALQRADVLKDVTLCCTVKVLSNKFLSETVLRELLEYGKFQGLGKFRQGGFGKFEYKLSGKTEEKSKKKK